MVVVSFDSTRALSGAFAFPAQTPRLRIVDTFVDVSEHQIRDFGLRTARPGSTPRLACMDMANLAGTTRKRSALVHDGIYFYHFESSSKLYYLPEGAKDGDFKKFWLTD